MIDRVEIRIKAGDGGDGAVAFRREKFVAYGGPDGGDGGKGGDVIIRADPSADSLRVLGRRRFFRAESGGKGQGKKKHGKKGEDQILPVPVGTLVLRKTQVADDALLADLKEPGQQVVVAKGGRGGRGNIHFTSSTNQAPRIAEKGEIREENSVILEMRLLADVGIIGYPNAGKSTLLSAVSAARPQIASYPFTTREPVLGMVEIGQQVFVLAEVPGIIDGAHLGRGMGHDFLRHIMRTKVLIHLVDGSAASPLENFINVNKELGLFDSSLAQKPQLCAVNKIDLPEVKSRLAEVKDAFSQAGVKVFFISAMTGEGVAELLSATAQLLSQSRGEAEVTERVHEKVFRPQPKERRPTVRKEGDVFVIVAPELERIAARVDLTSPEVRRQLKVQCDRMGISRALERAGIRPGDRVRCGTFEWEW